MKKCLLSIFLGCFMAGAALGQGEQNIWTFGEVGLDLNGPAPAAYSSNLFPAYEGSAAVCNAAGQMLFYTNGFWVWNRNQEIMPELTGGISGYTSALSPTVGYPPLMPWNGGYATQSVAVAGMPGHPSLYYLFSLSTTGNLYYSVVDMTLNGGLGGLAAGKKGILLATGLTEKLTVVRGCNNIWIMSRARSVNEYRAFELRDTGLVTSPVVSAVGDLPLSWYRCGVIKFSADGKRMVAACNEASNNKGGLELYDFDVLTGSLSNALVLDSSSTLGYYYGACFSPDHSKLYATTSSFAYGGTLHYGEVHQFNLNLSGPAAVIASNTVVYTNPVNALNVLGDLKRGPNGQIYFGNGLSAMHRISNPDLAGFACAPTPNVLSFAIGSTYRGLPNDLAIPVVPDSVHRTKMVKACYRDSLVLVADSGKQYLWDNGSTLRTRMVSANGAYVVRYINTDCKLATDTMLVRILPLPSVGATAYACPGTGAAKAWAVPLVGDTSTLQYSWLSLSGTTLRQVWSNSGDTVSGLDTGSYRLHIRSLSGCDTTVSVFVGALPRPLASFDADTVVCAGIPVLFLNTGTAPLWQWNFGTGDYSSENSPEYSYALPGLYAVSLVVTNAEGCRDTAAKMIRVNSLELDLTASKDMVGKGEQLYLTTSANGPYSILAWSPAYLFSSQTAKMQHVGLDTNTTIVVKAVSEEGCIGEASVRVKVAPSVTMPNVFSPNGDGKNDRFRPVAQGYIFVRYFEIYNRYGQQVFAGIGEKGLQGWDGTYKGALAEMGTYFYHINIETENGGTIYLKGDVVLMK